MNSISPSVYERYAPDRSVLARPKSYYAVLSYVSCYWVMTGSSLSPNRLADLYESLYIMLEALPADTHPAWELAIESVLFGGEGIAPETVPYGEQQAKRNEFRMAAYRARYGNGDHVTEFPTLSTEPPSGQDRQYVAEELQLPVSPDSETVLPLFVDDETLPEAVGLLNEFQTEPGEESKQARNANLLNPDLFPGLTASASDHPTTGDGQWTEQLATHQTELSPNELADLYDGLYTLLESLPNDAHPRWQEAIESILFGGAYLHSEASPYGEQQATRRSGSVSSGCAPPGRIASPGKDTTAPAVRVTVRAAVRNAAETY